MRVMTELAIKREIERTEKLLKNSRNEKEKAELTRQLERLKALLAEVE